MWTMCRAGVGMAAALLLAAAGPAAAQGGGVLAGVVLDDSTGEALGGARVQLLSANRRVLHTTTASRTGEFSIPIRRRGEYRLRASQTGFREVVTPALGVTPPDSTGVEVRMRTDQVLLAPLVVVARPVRRHRSPGLDAFRGRMASNMGGSFVTREDVDQRRPTRLTDILPQHGLAVTGTNVYFPRARCAPMVYIDGVLMTRYIGRSRATAQSPYEAINLVWSGDVEGIELYPGRATVPAEFGGPGAECGVVAIWTRRFEDA